MLPTLDWRGLASALLVWPYLCTIFIALRAPSFNLGWPTCEIPGGEIQANLRLQSPHRWPHPVWCFLLVPLSAVQVWLGLLGAPLLWYEHRRYLSELEELPEHKIAHVAGGITHGWRTFLYSLYLRFVVRANCRDFTDLERAAMRSPTAFLEDGLQPRVGSCPRIRAGLPQRQEDQRQPAAASEAVRVGIFGGAFFDPFRYIQCGPSKLEGSGAFGVCCVGRCRQEISGLQGECAHEHRVDGSWHVVLAPADALRVCRLGWAERGPPIVCQGMGPVGWIFVYAPRNETELTALKAILRAAVLFALSCD